MYYIYTYIIYYVYTYYSIYNMIYIYIHITYICGGLELRNFFGSLRGWCLWISSTCKVCAHGTGTGASWGKTSWDPRGNIGKI